MSLLVMLERGVWEGTTPIYTTRLTDAFTQPIPGSTLLSLQLTYLDHMTLRPINGREAQDVLNQNDVVVDESGLVTWYMQPEDTALVDRTQQMEQHLIHLTYSWLNAGRLMVDKHAVCFPVQLAPETP
jgi:hypothetical protein